MDEQNDPAPRNIRLSVLVCTHARADGLDRLLGTLLPQVDGHADREIVVVNDGTHDHDYAELTARLAGRLRYDVLPTSGGIAVARNRCIELARGQYVVFTDDDCEVPSHWLDWLDATLLSFPELDVLAGTARPLRPEQANFFGQVQAHYSVLLPHPAELGHGEQRFVTACLAVRLDLLRQIDGFSVDPIFATAGEDTELSSRLIRAGARTRIELGWFVYHVLSKSLWQEVRRKRRYGIANGAMARAGCGPIANQLHAARRRSEIPARFWWLLTRSPGGRPFPGQPIRASLARLAMALIQTAYEYGLTEGRARTNVLAGEGAQ